MLEAAARFTARAAAHLPVRALAVGAGLGWLAREMSAVSPGSTYQLLMALIMLIAGSAAFVLHALHRHATAKPAARSGHPALARSCVIWLGCGVAFALQGMPLVLA